MSRASLLPRESFVKQKLEDPVLWGTENQQLSILTLKLEQLIYLMSMTVDGNAIRKAMANKTIPHEVYEPEYFKEANRLAEEAKQHQKRADLAADVLKRTEEIKRALAAPRVSSNNPEDIEDAT